MNYFQRQFLMLLNQGSIVLYILLMHQLGHVITEDNVFHIIMVTLLFLDAAYISYKNINNNRTLNLFSALLLVNGWQGFLWIFESSRFLNYIATLLIPTTLFQIVRFLLAFLFQESTYNNQKLIECLITSNFVVSLIAIFFETHVFFLVLLAQYVLSFVLMIVVVWSNRERIRFVIQSHKIQLLLAVGCVCGLFVGYIFCFYRKSTFMDALGNDLIIMFVCVSIQSMLLGRVSGRAYSNRISSRRWAFLSIGIGTVGILVVWILGVPITAVVALGHVVIFFIQLYHLLVYHQVTLEWGESIQNKRSCFYAQGFFQIKKEEELKNKFSNYLHDDILQDLLAVRNLIGRAENPEIKQLIISVIDQLNQSIREEMHEYHPILLKHLTMRDNIENLIEHIGLNFPNHHCGVTIVCDNKTFLVEPYDIIIYRMMRELIRNIFKHSEATSAVVSLTQKYGEISLVVSDNGRGMTESNFGGGLSSITEQVEMLGGMIHIQSCIHTGTSIQINLPMKGEGSYEYFTSR